MNTKTQKYIDIYKKITNKIIANADKIGVSFSSTLSSFPKEKVVLTGNPCSETKKDPPPLRVQMRTIK